MPINPLGGNPSFFDPTRTSSSVPLSELRWRIANAGAGDFPHSSDEANQRGKTIKESVEEAYAIFKERHGENDQRTITAKTVLDKLNAACDNFNFDGKTNNERDDMWDRLQKVFTSPEGKLFWLSLR